jgi:hypothetical protein
MTITINYSPYPAPGYTPRKAVRLFNVESVQDKGPRMVEVRNLFTGPATTHDHVVGVVIIPEREDD